MIVEDMNAIPLFRHVSSIGSARAIDRVVVRWIPATLLALILVGCGQTGPDQARNDQAAAQFTPPAMRTPAPMPGQANANGLDAYVGRYPHETVGGIDFFDRSEVADALNDAVGDPKIRTLVVTRSGPTTPIFRDGTRLAAWGCVAHDCGDRNWTLFVPLKGGKPALCYHDAATMKDDRAWYEGGAPVRRPIACPSEPSA